IGKIRRGKINHGAEAVIVNKSDKDKINKIKVTNVYEFEGLDRIEVKEAEVGSIIAISGIPDIQIGDTICPPENPEALDFVKISEPTLSMTFSVNDSPFAGQDGKFVTSRQLRNRLYKELQTDVSLRRSEEHTSELQSRFDLVC